MQGMLCVACVKEVCPLFQELLLQSLKRVSCLLTRGKELAAGACMTGSHHYLTLSMAEERFQCSSKEEKKQEGEEGEEEEEEEEEEKETAACSSEGEEEEEGEQEAGTQGSMPGSKPPR